VTAPDFELDVRLRARRLTPRALDDADVEPEAVVLARERARSGLPAEIEPGGRYEAVEISKQIRGVIDADREPEGA
jgi:hypothetical protein